MTPRTQRIYFVAALFALWALFVSLAAMTPVLLDDWFQLRYWRDHAFSPGEIWAYGYYNYFHYNPRIGDVLLAIIDASRVIHVIVTPLVQLAALVTTFVIALGRWPRRDAGDLLLLSFIQVMTWLAIPIPGLLYFYRPFATNYLWAFTITLALFIPYRLALAQRDAPPRRTWLAPVMLVLGWVAGMCNEHTGPTAMVALAAFVTIAWRRAQLRAWMVAGSAGFYIGYPMLIFAPGQRMRYGAIATRETPVKLILDRGVIGCLELVGQFLYEARLALLLLAAAVIGHLASRRRDGSAGPPAIGRDVLVTVALLMSASLAMVVTLVASPATTDRVFYASAVLLVGACGVVAERLMTDRIVRRILAVACVLLLAFHVSRFVDNAVTEKRENDERLAALQAAPPGSVFVVKPYSQLRRSRWRLGDDFILYPWLAEYVTGELYDLANVDVPGAPARAWGRPHLERIYDPPLATPAAAPPLPTYREWLGLPAARESVGALLAPVGDHALRSLRIELLGLPFDDPARRAVNVVAWTPSGFRYIEGAPHVDAHQHVIRVGAATIPANVDSTYVLGCQQTARVEPVRDGPSVLVPVDERYCRGPFTAVMCEPDVCWIAGWY